MLRSHWSRSHTGSQVLVAVARKHLGHSHLSESEGEHHRGEWRAREAEGDVAGAAAKPWWPGAGCCAALPATPQFRAMHLASTLPATIFVCMNSQRPACNPTLWVLTSEPEHQSLPAGQTLTAT